MTKRLTIPIIVIVVIVLVIVAEALGSPRHRLGPRYSGPAGCPSWVAPYSTARCAWHSNVRRAVAHANQSHWVWVDGRAGSCSGNCVADTGYGGYGWSGYPTISNDTGATMYVYSVYLYG